MLERGFISFVFLSCFAKVLLLWVCLYRNLWELLLISMSIKFCRFFGFSLSVLNLSFSLTPPYLLVALVVL